MTSGTTVFEEYSFACSGTKHSRHSFVSSGDVVVNSYKVRHKCECCGATEVYNDECNYCGAWYGRCAKQKKLPQIDPTKIIRSEPIMIKQGFNFSIPKWIKKLFRC